MRKTLSSVLGILLVLGGLGVAVCATLVTFILPSKFASTARIDTGATDSPDVATAITTEVEKMQSMTVLEQVVTNLNLAKRWGEKFKEGELPVPLTCNLLKRDVSVYQCRGTSLIEVKVESDTPEEAAEIANQIVEGYRTSSLALRGPDGKPRLQIIDKAQPNPRPARPNKPLNIAVGCAAGGMLGVIGLALILWSFRTPKPSQAS